MDQERSIPLQCVGGKLIIFHFKIFTHAKIIKTETEPETIQQNKNHILHHVLFLFE